MPDLPSWPASVTAGESTTKAVALPAVTAGTGDARNWLRRLLNTIRPSAGRSAVITTDHNLQTQPAPQMIRRTFADLSGGASAARQLRSFPYDGNFAYIPHQTITHAAGKAIPLRTFDDGAHVPAIYAGNPSQGG